MCVHVSGPYQCPVTYVSVDRGLDTADRGLRRYISIGYVAQVTDRKAFYQAVAARVRAVAAERGVTRKSLAGPLGIGPDQLYLRTSGKVPFKIDELAILGEVLGVEPAEFIPASSSAISHGTRR